MLRPGRINFNSSVRLTVDYTDETGEAFDPDTVSFDSYSPEGRQTSYVYGVSELQRSVVGSYYIDFPANEVGRWDYRWVATDGTTYLYKEGQFQVDESRWNDTSRRAYQL